MNRSSVCAGVIPKSFDTDKDVAISLDSVMDQTSHFT